MPEVLPDTLIDGRYKVISRLGSGGMADVFCAEDQQLRRKVALKLLYRRFAEDPGFVERFRREAQAAAGLQHANVVSVYDRGAFDDTYYIAMEYLPGRSLKQLIREEAPLDPVRAIDITIQILKAARFAHHRGVIHRDLKPHNVIIDESDHAKVTDFGIARAGASDMTETGSIMGTAQYLSPEQAQGHAVSAGSDLYSVGVVLFELLTGRVPFDAEAAVTIALKHVSEAPPAPGTINPSVPPELEQVVMWALNKDPADRPADADQFIIALEAARAEIVGGAGGQRTAAIGVVGLGAAAPGGPPVPAAAQLAGTDSPPGAPPAPPVDGAPAQVGDTEPPGGGGREAVRPRGPRRWPWVVLLLLLIGGGAAAAYLLTRPVKVVVPNVVHEQVSTATTTLLNEGLRPTILNLPNTAQAGTVFGQDPLGGTKLNKGSTVTLRVSQGPGNVPIPSVNGLSEQQAKARIARAHLKVDRVQNEPSDQVAAGLATRTEPAVGQSEPVGTPITLFVSSGPAPVSVPDVTGQPEAQASGTLREAGFRVSSSTQESSTDTPGTVISQSPTGTAPPHSTVSIVVAKAPTTATVPNVVGSTASSAAAQLTAAGFTVQQHTKDVTKATQNGVVLSQSPAANSTAKKSSAVTIVVGKYKAPPPTTSTTSTTTTSTTTTTTTTSP